MFKLQMKYYVKYRKVKCGIPSKGCTKDAGCTIVYVHLSAALKIYKCKGNLRTYIIYKMKRYVSQLVASLTYISD